MLNTKVAVAVVACLAVLSGCGVGQMPTASKASKAVSSKSAALKTPNIKVITSETAVSPVAADEAVVNLEFSIENPAVRQLMGVNDIEVTGANGGGAAAAQAPDFAGQVASVEFTLTVAGGAPLKYTVTKAQFLNGKAVVQFNNLAPGNLTVSAVAKDAAGKVLVSANGDGQIKTGELTLVKLKCVLPPVTGVGHVRLEMDCWSADCGPQPTPVPTAFVPAPVKIVEFHSTGDPHEEGGNGLKFENQLSGTFLAMQTLTRDFVMIKNQDKDPLGRWEGTTINNAVAIKNGGDVFAYYLYGHRARLNGKAVAIAGGQTIKAPGGMQITRVASLPEYMILRVTTPQGDEARFADAGFYMNIDGTIGRDRVVYEVNGELGTYSNDKPEMAMMLRNGNKAPNLDTFLKDWYATKEENFFPTGEAFLNKTYDGSPLPPNKPTN